MASEWEEQFKQMRAQFFERARQRLKNTAVLLAAAAGASDALLQSDALEQLQKDFHWLAGTGGTYKLPEMTEIGCSGEDICLRLLKSDRAAQPDEPYDRLAQLLKEAEQLIDAADS